MASWGETSLLDYSLEREGGHDEPWDFCNLDEDPLFSLRGGQKIRIKAACSTAGIALWADLIRVDPVANLFFGRVRESGRFDTGKTQSTLYDPLVSPKGESGLEEIASAASTEKESPRE